MTDQQRNKQLVKRALDEVFSAGNFGVLEEIFHPDFINHEAGPDTPPGPQGLKVTVGWIRDSFSDLHYEIEDSVAEGDKVAVRVTASGRHTGKFIGFEPTGKSYKVKQMHMYRFKDGKIIEHWSVRDDLDQGMQLGFVPGGAAA
jgi:predicted ester cyclase